MNHETQVRLIEGLISHLDSGTNADAGGHLHNPTSVYVDPALAAREWDVFFRNHPQVIGLSGDLVEPGQYMTINDFGVPIIASRDADGTFVAMVNACRHRGALVVEDERGTARRFTCRFHNWSYDNSGALVGVPKREHFGDFDMSCSGLIRLPAVEKYGLLWVHPLPDGEIDPVELLTPELASELETWDLGAMRPDGRMQFDVNCNWKLAIDTFGETYHFPSLHQNTINLGFHGNVSSHEKFGRNHRFLLCRRGIDHVRTLPREQWRITEAATPAYWLFPNIQLLPTDFGAFFIRICPDPANPAHHISRITVFFRTESSDGDADDNAHRELQRHVSQFFTDIIRDEDYVMSASQQVTANSGALSHVVFGRNEPALHHYHNTYRAVLGMDPLPLLIGLDA